MKREARRGWLEMDRRAFFAVLAVIAVIAMVAAMYLLVVSRTAGQGRRIQRLRGLLEDQQRINAHLEVSIARASSAHNLFERAGDLNLVPAGFDQLLFVRQADE